MLALVAQGGVSRSLLFSTLLVQGSGTSSTQKISWPKKGRHLSFLKLGQKAIEGGRKGKQEREKGENGEGYYSKEGRGKWLIVFQDPFQTSLGRE